MEAWLRDARYALRALRREATFSVAVILTLALAIGANAAIFTIVNALMFRPLPYPDQRRLMFVSSSPARVERRLGASHADYTDWRRQATSFESLGIAGPRNFALGGSGRAEMVSGARISASLFDVFGLRPLAGRVFADTEDRPGDERVVVLGENLWRRLFDGDRAVVGREIAMDGELYTIVGIMPRDFAYPDHAELWVPLQRASAAEERGIRSYAVIGRLRATVSVEQAQAEMRTIASRLAKAYPATNADTTVLVTRLGEGGGPRSIVFAFLISLSAGGFVLLIACANVANLLLARTARRGRELAIRSAIGATRYHLARLLLIEGIVLALPSVGLALLLAQAARDAILGMVPGGIPVWMRFDIDWRVFAFTLSAAGVAVVLSTLSPALHAWRVPGSAELKEAGNATGAGRHRLRDAMVVAEMALTLVLLVGAGLMVRSFLNVASIDPGLATQHVLTARLPLTGPRYPVEGRDAFHSQLTGRISSLPGVRDVALTSLLPLVDSGRGAEYRTERQEGARGSGLLAQRAAVSRSYFAAIGLPILQGRAFDTRDTAASQPVAIVSRAFAERHWPREDPVGRRVQFVDDAAAPWVTVVGVAGDVRYWRLSDDNLPVVYVPLAQAPGSSPNLVVRTAADPALLAKALRAEIARLDPNLPVVDLMTLDDAVSQSRWAERLFTYLFQAFGLAAAGLALVGIFGVVSYSVAQRLREIGIRVALGAGPRAVWALVVGHAARLAVLGVLLGMIAAPALTRAMSRILYAVTPYDPLTFVGVGLLLLALAVGTACLPARRAARLDALDSLRRS